MNWNVPEINQLWHFIVYILIFFFPSKMHLSSAHMIQSKKNHTYLIRFSILRSTVHGNERFIFSSLHYGRLTRTISLDYEPVSLRSSDSAFFPTTAKLNFITSQQWKEQWFSYVIIILWPPLLLFSCPSIYILIKHQSTIEWRHGVLTQLCQLPYMSFCRFFNLLAQPYI